MSLELFNYAKSFLAGEIPAEEFVDTYQKKWDQERDARILSKDDDVLREALSSIFCIAEQYNPDSDRDEYEYDDDQLHKEMTDLLVEKKLIEPLD